MADVGRGLSGAASGAAMGTAFGPVGSVVGGLIGGIGGLASGSGGKVDKRTKALQLQALEQLQNLKGPEVEQLKLQLEDLKSQGKLTPEMEDTIMQQASGMGNISTDPRLKDAQMSALAKMQGIANEGLSAQDRLRLNDSRRQIAGDTRAADEQILQQMAQRGAGGSGSELAARMISSQGQADRASRAGDEIAAQANQQALQAIMNSGNLGGQMQAQDFSQEAQKAQAQDAVNRFNAANQQQVLGTNVGNRNSAAEFNLRNDQSIANSNVGTHNEQQKHNKELLVDDYNRQVDRAKLMSGALNKAADQNAAAGQRSNDKFAGVVGGLASAGTTIAGGLGKAPRIALDDQLDNLSNTTNSFKTPSLGSSTQPASPYSLSGTPAKKKYSL